MDVSARLDTERAFDAVASSYHQSNVENAILAAMRERFWHAVCHYVPPGSHLLDLGCGPGTDEEHFATNGYRTTAIDSSSAMVAEARRRVAGLRPLVDVRQLGIDELPQLAPQTFDAICSNLGPFNCVIDLAQAAAQVVDRLRPGGWLIASVIGRVCPWEIALYACRGDWTRLRVRFGRALTPIPLEGRTVWMRYHSPGSFERVFAEAGLRPVDRRALAVLVPPPYMDAFGRRHPTLVGSLQRIEDAVARWPIVRACGDHFLVVMQKPE